jgi:hypothetical protein
LWLLTSAFALDYSSQNNQATFETLEEARVSGPLAVATIAGEYAKHFSRDLKTGANKYDPYVK